MAYRKDSVNRKVSDEYCFMRFEAGPRYGTPAWEKWLTDFTSRRLVEVNRMNEPLAERAVKVLRHDIPDFE